jgi:glycogen synthase
MKILLSSHGFHPSIGGIEDVSLLLALEFARCGHEVRVITRTVSPSERSFPFPVERAPSALALLRAVAWCEVFFHNNLSLRTAWPLLLFRRPWVVAHHTWISRPDGRIAWQDRLKRRVVRRAASISGGSAIARSLGWPMTVIENPYDANVFRIEPGLPRDGTLIFVGRLVSDKGADLLLDALARLKERGCRPDLTVVGGGPEESSLRRQVAALELDSQVKFTGFKSPEELAVLLSRHRLLVVPSRRAEPFGLVALEGIACGCVVVGSEQGGLKEAIGPCGLTFANGEVGALVTALETILRLEHPSAVFLSQAAAHLQKHRPETVAQAYLNVLTRAAGTAVPDATS